MSTSLASGPAGRAPSAVCVSCLCSMLPELAPPGGSGLPDEPVLKDYEPKRWVGTPKSGLRIIVQEDHSSPAGRRS